MEPSPRASRRLGQNFLRARWVAREFARWACGFTRLLEIGVGQGFLTSEILRRCRPSLLVGIELDRRLMEWLGSLSFFHPVFAPVQADALSPPVVLERFDAVYGSIPYSITGPLLSLLSVEAQKPAMLLLQREVVDRIAARPAASSYGRITVLVQLVYRVKPGPVVPPSAFRPRPRVYSRIVVLEPREDRPGREELRRVEELTRCMFSGRNRKAAKQASRCLGLSRDEAEKLLGGRRVYELSPSDFYQLAVMA
ncbi:hypothetical protein CF15_02650 [Pyrodictium occultum]|uniref:Ribosomal RNA adenine methylase transferase N-terminal domain-containing protein n=1 Tax=Pyrodictium occultum TaxID=2309 RepID=A0A0V8RUH7_PYROC|nr:16S rRNA (adenine(1518)-N(6)/adenine(1519)-N(6))-dimethyltransferase RsmA [Pyrodictium occultum]KSW11733.1 hypothetical protein CF15_02650 [Pyrodictium occultum]